MREPGDFEVATMRIPVGRRRDMLVSKWRSLPAMYWSIVVGILTVFSVLQPIFLAGWSSLALTGLLLVLFSMALVAAIIVARRQKTPTEKLAMARTLFSEARRRFGERDYSGAETAAKRSVELDPEESSTWNILGRAQIRLGKPAEAIEAYARALDVNRQPDWRTIYLNNRAVARILNREFGHARNDFNECVAESPHSWTRLRWRALASLYMGDLLAAQDDAKASVKEASERVSNQAVLAIIATAAGKASQAAEANEKIVGLRAEKPEDYYYFAALKCAQGESDEALRLLAISIQLDDKMKPRGRFDPLWDSLREDARFKGLVEPTS